MSTTDEAPAGTKRRFSVDNAKSGADGAVTWSDTTTVSWAETRKYEAGQTVGAVAVDMVNRLDASAVWLDDGPFFPKVRACLCACSCACFGGTTCTLYFKYDHCLQSHHSRRCFGYTISSPRRW